MKSKDELDFEDMYDYFYTKGNNNFLEYPKAEVIGLDEFWKLEVDILILAALENIITREVAEKINAKLVCEAANGPTTTDTDGVLENRGIHLIPDILTNSGGVTVSYFEWVQNLYGYYWVNAFNDIYKIKEKYSVTMRQAAYMHSVKKVAETIKLRGWY